MTCKLFYKLFIIILFIYIYLHFLFFTGRNNGVATQLKNKNPFITAIHCIAYQFALVGKDSAKDVPYFKEYESTLKRLYGYFSRSYNRLKNLRMIQAEDNDDPGLAILKLVSTRW